MNLDNPRAFDVLLDDRIRLSGSSPIPCSLLSNGAMAMGGARQVAQLGEHYFVRVETSRMIKPFVFGDTMTLEKKGAALVKEIHTEGEFTVYTVTAHARRAVA
jgi:hypothetical protein